MMSSSSKSKEKSSLTGSAVSGTRVQQGSNCIDNHLKSPLMSNSVEQSPITAVNPVSASTDGQSQAKTTGNTDDDELKDPFCDPEHPVVVQFEDVSAAAFKIRGGIERTPCHRSHMSSLTGVEIYFKKDFMQYTGSFKERGARFTLIMLTKEQREHGVIAASAGNHALALAYHGSDLKIPITVVMPLIAPMMKIQLCRQFGATVIVHGQHLGEAKLYAMRLAKEKNMLYINGYDHPHILAGQGTVGLEIVEQVPDMDAVLIPVGGGGLLAGTALAVKSLYPHVRIYGVESERCASFKAAMDAGKPVYTTAEPTLADGLAVPTVGVNAFATAAPLVDKIIAVREEFIALAILRLIEMEKAVVEGAGAIGLAAVLGDYVPELKGKKVVILLCGGNIDTTVLGRCLERGLAADGRLCRFVVTVSDRPGGIAELTKRIASIGVSLKDIFHERAWLKSDIFNVQVKCVVETRDQDHASELEKLLRDNYSSVYFGPNIF
jgi:threonine dehydratase